ncbi:uncharacterized protein [Diabrotica undecimpunctata]|uniref:uncharacterized protein n=1 Tax=Diabrotica undecimpunctata TaxID=50387 RepID=UPI003B63304A
MATIYELTVTNLRRHLEDRELASTGKKAELVQRLKNALLEEGLDPETYIFEDAVLSSISKVSGDVAKVSGDVAKVSGDVAKVSGDIASLENKVSGDIASLESKVSNEISSLESKVSANISSEISKVTSEMSALDDRISSLKNQVAADKLAFEEKIKEMERKMEETGTAERGNNPITVEIKEDETKCKLEIRPKFEGSGGSVHVKVPTFDGKSSWNNYMKQFESAARANGWSEKEKAVNLTIALRGDALDCNYQNWCFIKLFKKMHPVQKIILQTCCFLYTSEAKPKQGPIAITKEEDKLFDSSSNDTNITADLAMHAFIYCDTTRKISTKHNSLDLFEIEENQNALIHLENELPVTVE